MALTLEYPEGATPLDPDELADLIPPGIATVGQLNAFEAENIASAIQWLEGRRSRQFLDERFLADLHRRMFDRTWKWAGKFRQTEKNIGVAPYQISTHVRNFVEDFRTQFAAVTRPSDEMAVRLHHRLVAIHPFANGNGRHSRLLTDLLLESYGIERFTWGAKDLLNEGSGARKAYIAALRAADKKDFSPLIAFVRS